MESVRGTNGRYPVRRGKVDIVPPVNKVPPGLRQRSNLGVVDNPVVIVEVKIVVKGVEENSGWDDN